MASPLLLVLALAWLLLFMRECMSEGQPWGPRLGLGDPGRAGQSLDAYEFFNYTQTIDHFNYRPESYATFQQSYAINFKHWGGENSSSPIFVYTGDEANLKHDIGATGIMDDLGSIFKALIVYIEHRYYGTSMPFGSKSEAYQNSSTLGYFSSAQALADYAKLIRHLKTKYKAENSPVIAVGGSYGGMLASWLRLKYPHIAIGALASSAPVLYFEDITPENAFYVVVTDNYRNLSESCYRTIRQSWFEIDHQNQLRVLEQKFNTCSPLTSTRALKYYLEDMYVRAAMYDSPPVEDTCGAIDGAPPAADILDRIFAAVRFVNKGTCTNVSAYGLSPLQITGWTWQRCTEMVMPLGRGEYDTMFQERPFDLANYTRNCKYWTGGMTGGVTPRPHWITTHFGGHDRYSTLKHFASNIIFSNGLRDPYSAGGVLENISDSVVAIKTKYGTHCADLHPLSKDDPDWLASQKRAEIEIMEGWINDYNAQLLQGAVNKHGRHNAIVIATLSS